MSLADLTDRILRRIREMSDDELAARFERELARVREARGTSEAVPEPDGPTSPDEPSPPPVKVRRGRA